MAAIGPRINGPATLDESGYSLGGGRFRVVFRSRKTEEQAARDSEIMRLRQELKHARHKREQ
jgi:hypothetical protein